MQVPLLLGSPEVQEHPWAHAHLSGAPPLGEPTHTGTYPTTIIDNYNAPHPHLSS
jgi:hypothetical protein